MRDIKIIAVACLNNDILEQNLEHQHYGFLLNPIEREGHLILEVRFELLLPIDQQQHLFCKTITTFALEQADRNTLRAEVETLAGLIQTCMANTRMFIMLNNPNLTHLQLKYFDNQYFMDEIQTQFAELGI
ncbi:hypothetical protein [Chryseobacterium sp. 'Rf worker isolate 10']|jgi:hypothetical protein|uniref:hypothetical protein n=1 Tax=Chryseobacterium sp. 'Rf worker isolate 10' TaxID=2887348 RepID=UPI003D6E0657